MRTTLDLDDDIVEIARDMASRRKQTLGQVVSDLARTGLAPSQKVTRRNGVPLLTPKPGVRATLTLVNRLRDES